MVPTFTRTSQTGEGRQTDAADTEVHLSSSPHLTKPDKGDPVDHPGRVSGSEYYIKSPETHKVPNVNEKRIK